MAKIRHKGAFCFYAPSGAAAALVKTSTGVCDMTKRKRRIVVATYILAALAVAAGFAYKNYLTAQYYKLQLHHNYQHALNELADGVGQMDAALQKSICATTPSMLSTVCTEVYAKSQLAGYALGQLPSSENGFEKTAGFIAKVGDYAFSISRRAATEDVDTKDAHEKLTLLSNASSVLAGNLYQLVADLSGRVIDIRSAVESAESAAGAADEVLSQIQTSLTMDEALQDMPTLIYDGPFSSHIAEMTPRMTEGKENVSREKAHEIAAMFIGEDMKKVKSSGEREGGLPAYLFTANKDKGVVSIEVTKKGGFVSAAFNSRLVKNRAIDRDSAVAIADKYLKDHGYSSMKQSYSMISNNILTVNYAYEQNGVVCYPDLIKVSVAMDNGAVVGFEAQGYIVNHQERDLPQPKVSREEAEGKIAENLTVDAYALAVIPTSGKNEFFCHEFKCTSSDGRKYIVYIDCETGQEQDILILQETPEGVLAM